MKLSCGEVRSQGEYWYFEMEDKELMGLKCKVCLQGFKDKESVYYCKSCKHYYHHTHFVSEEGDFLSLFPRTCEHTKIPYYEWASGRIMLKENTEVKL